MTVRIDYEVTSAVGALLYTSPDKDLAKRWASEQAEVFPGLSVEEVVTTVQRRRVYRPALRLVAS